jgi:hypothetical protein
MGLLYLLREKGVAFRGKVWGGGDPWELFFNSIFQDILTLVSVALMNGSFTKVLV